jgi:hypothetical protein
MLGQKRNFLREVNETIRTVATRLGIAPAHRRLGFVCECGEPGCAELVHLTPAEYDRRNGDGSLYADGHSAAKAR